jgi:hypothetical protein
MPGSVRSERCENCTWWEPKERYSVSGPLLKGDCHGAPPVPDSAGPYFGSFPITHMNSYCSFWRAKKSEDWALTK